MMLVNVNPDQGNLLAAKIDLPRSTIVIAGLAVLFLILGGLATPLGPWYYALNQPSWKPPDFLFGPVWTTIFALAGYAAVKCWNASETKRERQLIAGLFITNGVLNFLWSILFFTLQRPDWALIEVGFLWASIVALAVFLRPIAPVVVPALAPYLLWVSFAAALNTAIVQLNPPFG